MNDNNKHLQDLSTSELKSLIKILETESDVNCIYQHYLKIESYLMNMKQTKCNFDLKTYISILFQNIIYISNIYRQKRIYVSMYLQLFFVFPELKHVLESYNSHNKIFSYIMLLKNNEEALLYIFIY